MDYETSKVISSISWDVKILKAVLKDLETCDKSSLMDLVEVFNEKGPNLCFHISDIKDDKVRRKLLDAFWGGVKDCLKMKLDELEGF